MVPFQTPKILPSSSNTNTGIELQSQGENNSEKHKLSTLSHFIRSSSHKKQDSLDSDNSRRSSSNSSCLTGASMENQVSRGGSTSPCRISGGDLGHSCGSSEQMRIEECDEIDEDPLGVFPATRPSNHVRPPAPCRWSMQRF